MIHKQQVPMNATARQILKNLNESVLVFAARAPGPVVRVWVLRAPYVPGPASSSSTVVPRRGHTVLALWSTPTVPGPGAGAGRRRAPSRHADRRRTPAVARSPVSARCHAGVRAPLLPLAGRTFALQSRGTTVEQVERPASNARAPACQGPAAARRLRVY
jgi:hypothetical protein